jgi:hypothetical protein
MALIGSLVVCALGIIPTLIGFTSSGIALGSIAAWIQSLFGNVVAGSLFASLQSLGALGVFSSMALYGGIAFICIVVGIFIAYGIYKLLENN